MTAFGNYLVFPYHFGDEGILEEEISSLSDEQQAEIQAWKTWKAKHADPRQITQDIIPMGTGGTFAEAILGRFNSSEKLDITRFWDWQTSPIPVQAPEIAALQSGSRGTTENAIPGRLDAPVVNIMNPPNLPDPQGVNAVLNAITASNLFRDMSGLAGTLSIAQQGLQTANEGAIAGATLASQNFSTAAQLELGRLQAAAQIAMAANGLPASGSTSSITNPSYAGAMINHGKKLDQNSSLSRSNSTGAIDRSRTTNGSSSNGAGSNSGNFSNNSGVQGDQGTNSFEADAFRNVLNPAYGTTDATNQLIESLQTGNGTETSAGIQLAGSSNRSIEQWLPLILHRPEQAIVQRLRDKFKQDAPDTLSNFWP
ncbi:MAG: hypothetical protein AAF959_27115, partial [Cyanobacteria bacterium P01_D01_bin.56]